VDIVVLPTRLNADLEYFPDSKPIHQITIDGIPLAAIKLIHKARKE